jgi:tetratricopeptide (TPR) repeat protein
VRTLSAWAALPLGSWLLGACLLPVPAGAAGLPEEPALPRGEVIERVAATKDAGLTYALYLPSIPSTPAIPAPPGRPAPILYAFDYRGDARDLTVRLRAAAERYGWIVASPYGSSHLIPMEENFKIMSGLWADTHARLAIDDKRVYAFGFSGLVRFACMLGLTAPEGLAGVIGASGGFPLGHPPTRDTPFPFFATVGDKDFNYYELLDLDEKMATLGIPHRVEVFAGAHEWPSEALLGEALGWMELQAMRRGTREKNPALLAALWDEDLARAKALEAEGKPLAAFRAYTALAADFAGLREARDLDEIALRRAALQTSEAFQNESKVRMESDRRDREYLEKVPLILAAAPNDGSPQSLAQTVAELAIPELKRRAKTAADPEDKLAAERLLNAVYIQTGLHLPREAAERKQYDRAIFYLRIAGEIDPDVPHIPFRMAVAWAQQGNRPKALELLTEAVRKGWTDLVALESERSFDPFRRTEGYKRIVAELLRRQRLSAR